MPTRIRRSGASVGGSWVASIFAAIKIDRILGGFVRPSHEPIARGPVVQALVRIDAGIGGPQHEHHRVEIVLLCPSVEPRRAFYGAAMAELTWYRFIDNLGQSENSVTGED